MQKKLTKRERSAAAKALGRIGGSRRVPKGFAVMDPGERAKISRAAIAKRWANRELPADQEANRDLSKAWAAAGGLVSTEKTSLGVLRIRYSDRQYSVIRPNGSPLVVGKRSLAKSVLAQAYAEV